MKPLLNSICTDTPITNNNNITVWQEEPNDYYLATGVDRNGKRFRISSKSFRYIQGINIFKGNKWLVRNNKRYRISSINN